MARDYAGIWRKLAIRRLLGGFILLGVILVVTPHVPAAVETYPEWVRNSCIEFGKAFVIAGILGWAIDEALKQDLVREAVAASLGYLLPERLKPELRWLYDQKILVQQTYAVRLEHFPEEKAVKFCGTYNRRFENVSGEKTELQIGGGTDEWFHPKGETVIDACEFRRIKGDTPESTTAIEVKKAAIGIGYDTGTVVIDAGEVIELFMSYTMWMHEHGYEFLTHRYLIDRPIVNVEVPPSLVAFVAFSHRDNFSEEDFKTGHISKRLERILLPHQDIRICWHRKTNVDERVQKYGLKKTS